MNTEGVGIEKSSLAFDLLLQMTPFPQSSIDEHFTHIPKHRLNAFESDQEYLCGGCKTDGVGKRFRCGTQGCDFDMHEYCATCPTKLSSFMHNHELSLVMRKSQNQCRVNRICDVCTEPVEGLFYRCKLCEFDVHPQCTQLPKQLCHALHKIHPLNLESEKEFRLCKVCKKHCNGWRYRCVPCSIDIHLECVLVPVVQCPQQKEKQEAPSTPPKPGSETKQRGIPNYGPWSPYRPPLQFSAYNYAHGYPYYGGAGVNMHYNQHAVHPGCFVPQYNQGAAVGAVNAHGAENPAQKPKKSMFSLVGQLGVGVLSNMIFGFDLGPLFA